MGGLKWFSLSSAQAYIWCLASSCTSPLRERERQRPMMRHWIKGRDRLFPTAATALRVTECKKKKKKGVVHCVSYQAGWLCRVWSKRLEAGCFAYLSLSSRAIKRVWPAAECAGSRSRRSCWAEAAEGCLSPPVGATQLGRKKKDMKFYKKKI